MKKWRCDIYGVDFVFFFGVPHKQFKKWIDSNVGKGFLETELGSSVDYSGLTIKNRHNKSIIIWTDKKDYSVLAHECLHACMTIFKWVGIEPDVDNDEPLAYLLSAIMENSSK